MEGYYEAALDEIERLRRVLNKIAHVDELPHISLGRKVAHVTMWASDALADDDKRPEP
jgi:hypothetical protein